MQDDFIEEELDIVDFNNEIIGPDIHEANELADRELVALLPAPEVEEEKIILPYELTIKDNIKKDHKLLHRIDGMAKVIMRENYFAIDGPSGELMVFIDHGRYGGIYIPAAISIRHAVMKLAKEYNYEEEWAMEFRRKQVVSFIKDTGLRVIEEPETTHLNVANGLLYFNHKGEMWNFSSEWSPDYLTTTKLPVSYDPDAKCPLWEKFVAEVFPEDAPEIAWQIAALLMLPIRNKAASAIILKGMKNTGKSTFQNGLIAFLGNENVSSLSLDRFGERFQDTRLKGKLANIAGELVHSKLSAKAVNSIKQLIGNDLLQGEIKGGASFEFRSYARCLFSCNDIPSCDYDDAFWDRFLVIPFNRKQFQKNPLSEKVISEGLASSEELSGLLNKAIEALPSVMLKGIQPSSSMEKELKEAINESDPLMKWFSDNYEKEQGTTSLFTAIHEHYKKHEPTDRQRHSGMSFGRAFKKLLPRDIIKVQIQLDDGSRPYAYRNLKLKDDPKNLIEEGLMEFDLESLEGIELS